MMGIKMQELEDRISELEEENALLHSRLEDKGDKW